MPIMGEENHDDVDQGGEGHEEIESPGEDDSLESLAVDLSQSSPGLVDVTHPDYSIPGMRIHIRPEESEWDLIVRSVEERTDWMLDFVHLEEQMQSGVIPTTISYRGQSYRIYEVDQVNDGWIYRMKRCPSGETHRRWFELSREAIERAIAEDRKHRRELAKVRASVYYDWMLGWLPATVQYDLADHMNFDPAGASSKNAFVELACGVFLGVAGLILMFTSGAWESAVAGVYVVCEALVRCGHSQMSGRPLGFLPLEAMARTFKVYRSIFH